MNDLLDETKWKKENGQSSLMAARFELCQIAE